eukprot:CAMPEP_0183710958 /NCGR_PEP_ID=MMETSP0737-20130205/6565_1 /TAXON_ID=385413 /ORGANISM="Thalassiosira miniscula, Strain CCMP1093" /LENGTH=450 /DNA_ID=CAMNT_0025939337 /DNA_START=58 /DNA_END=1410 /DNA_ORIENTATION=+
MRKITILILAAVFILAFHSNWVVAAPSDDDSAISESEDTNAEDDAATTVNEGEEDEDALYESKIKEALSYHSDKSHEMLQRVLKEGGAAAAMEIDADGNVVSSSQDELWQAEFAIQALERELKMLKEMTDVGDYEEYFSGDEGEYYSGDEGEYYSGDEGEEYYEGEDYYSEDYSEDYGEDEHNSFASAVKEIFKNDESLKAMIDAIEDEIVRGEVLADIVDEKNIKDTLDPDLWYRFSYWEMHSYFSCNRAFAGKRPVYDAAKWAALRDHYQIFRENDKVDKPLLEGEHERTYQFSTETFDPPLIPFQTAEKGRGLQAARNIKKGELVFQATNNTVIFTHGHTWRKFLFSIYEKEEEDLGATCDTLVWSWVQTLEEDGPLVIVADLDNGSLLNEGRDEEGWEAPNVRCGKEGDKICMMSYYATKDIEEGSELLCDYRDFAFLDSWPEMGL